MKRFFSAIAIAAVTLMNSPVISVMKADEWDKRTVITIPQAIDVQGTILAPGSYVIKVPSGNSSRDIVQIADARDNHVIATLLAMPAWRPEPTDRSAFDFYQASNGRTPALRKWFYPGDNSGVEFRFAGAAIAIQAAQAQSNPATPAAGN